ncbi:MAG TPA: SigE family RNA polymerase sigma factor [Mycobacteriales bacterium]
MAEELRDLYEASYRRLVAQVGALTRDVPEAEDVVQDAFSRAVGRWNKISRYDDPERWVRTVAMNLARSRWRRARRGSQLTRTAAVTDLPPRQPSPDRVAVVAAMRKLPAAQRDAIALHHLADLPVDEVARQLGVPAGTVKARLSRGRAALAVALDDTQEANR